MDFDQGHEVSQMLLAQCHVYKHMLHFIESLSLKCAVQLGIPDIIHEHGQPITVLDLVSALQVPPAKANCLERLMRLLAHSGFFEATKARDGQKEEEGEEESYALTNSSRLLLKDSSTSLSTAVVALLDPALLSPWFSLDEWYRGNDLTAFDTHHGMSFWEYRLENREFMEFLDGGLASDSKLVSLLVRDQKQIFEGVTSLVDVGGGVGALSRAISAAQPRIKCTVLDLPQVVANLQDTENLKFVGGDMFQYIPCADAILIKSVLHNWSDDHCIKLLKRCREAIQSKDEGGKLILVEMVIDEKKDECEHATSKLFLDMLMLLTTTGRERTENEWAKLFLQAGFRHYKITATPGLHSIIEVYP